MSILIENVNEKYQADLEILEHSADIRVLAAREQARQAEECLRETQEAADQRVAMVDARAEEKRMEFECNLRVAEQRFESERKKAEQARLKAIADVQEERDRAERRMAEMEALLQHLQEEADARVAAADKRAAEAQAREEMVAKEAAEHARRLEESTTKRLKAAEHAAEDRVGDAEKAFRAQLAEVMQTLERATQEASERIARTQAQKDAIVAAEARYRAEAAQMAKRREAEAEVREEEAMGTYKERLESIEKEQRQGLERADAKVAEAEGYSTACQGAIDDLRKAEEAMRTAAKTLLGFSSRVGCSRRCGLVKLPNGVEEKLNLDAPQVSKPPWPVYTHSFQAAWGTPPVADPN